MVRKGALGPKVSKKLVHHVLQLVITGSALLHLLLQQQNRRYVPHRLTLIPVLPGINMVVISEVRFKGWESEIR